MTECIINCCKRNAASMATRGTDPAYRRQEQIVDTNHRRSTRCTYPEYRRQEQIADTNHRRLTRQTNPPVITAQK
jgi:hypothetical protein